jgi:MFS family permease
LRDVFSLHVRRQIKELYLFLLISSFSWSLITIFEPVFLYKQGLTISFIALYYAIHYTTYVIMLPFGGKFAARFGFERSLAVSTPILIGYFLVLAAVPYFPTLIWIAPLILTLHKIFYWPALHATFAEYGFKKNQGTELSWQKIISYSMGIAGPLIGGLIVVYMGFSALFIFTALTLVAAGIPLLWTQEHCQKAVFPYKSPWKLIRQPGRRRFVISIAGWVENLVYLTIWPILLFVVLRDVILLGLVASASVAIMTIGSLYIGKLTDRHGAKRVLQWTSIFTAASYMLRVFAWVPLVAVVSDVWARMANTSIEIPYLAELYTSAKKEAQPLTYVLSFEMTLAAYKAVGAFLLVDIFLLFPPIVGFIITFTLAGVMALFYREF